MTDQVAQPTLHKMLFIEHTRLNSLRASCERNLISMHKLPLQEAADAAREAELRADYLQASIFWHMAADTYPESQQYYRKPLLIKALLAENLYRIFHELCKLIDGNLTFGKRMGDCVYIHSSYQRYLPTVDLQCALSRLDEATRGAYQGNVIKWDRRSGCFTFIWSPDFLTADEPVVQEWWSVPKNKAQAVRFGQSGANPLIYHHKFLFVRHDFELFDIAASIKRSLAWKQVPLERDAYRKIGRRDYWQSEVVPFIKPLL